MSCNSKIPHRVAHLRNIRMFKSQPGVRDRLHLNRSTLYPKFNLPIQARHNSSRSKFLPRIADPSMWQSLVPTFLRRREPSTNAAQTKEWNPASYFIIIFLLIGSQAIRIIGLQKDFQTQMRRMDAKLELLRRVVEGIQRGEEVDVEKMLGTGDVQKEREWEEVLKEIEAEDSLWHPRGNTIKKPRSKSDKTEPKEATNEKSDSTSSTENTKSERSTAKFY